MIKIVREAVVTDYVSSEEFDNLMLSKEFGSFDTYRQLDGMRVQTTKYRDEFPGATSGGSTSRYWKFIKSPDGWEAYEIDENGKMISNPFSLESIFNEGNQVTNTLPPRIDNFS